MFKTLFKVRLPDPKEVERLLLIGLMSFFPVLWPLILTIAFEETTELKENICKEFRAFLLPTLFLWAALIFRSPVFLVFYPFALYLAFTYLKGFRQDRIAFKLFLRGFLEGLLFAVLVPVAGWILWLYLPAKRAMKHAGI